MNNNKLFSFMILTIDSSNNKYDCMDYIHNNILTILIFQLFVYGLSSKFNVTRNNSDNNWIKRNNIVLLYKYIILIMIFIVIL